MMYKASGAFDFCGLSMESVMAVALGKGTKAVLDELATRAALAMLLSLVNVEDVDPVAVLRAQTRSIDSFVRGAGGSASYGPGDPYYKAHIQGSLDELAKETAAVSAAILRDARGFAETFGGEIYHGGEA